MKDKKQHIKKDFSLESIKNSGFKKPINYLESFEDDLFVKISEENLPSKSGFKVPLDYFDTLEDRISSKMAQEKPKTKIISFSTITKRFIPYAAAASILLFIGINYFSTNVDIDDLSETEIENWLYADNNSDEIANVLEITDFEDTNITDNINDVEIENYLDNIDTSTLINEIN